MSRDVFQRLFLTAPLGTMSCDPQGRPIHLNRTARDRLGLEADALPDYRLFDDPDLPDAAASALRRGDAARGALRLGGDVPIPVLIAPLPAVDDDPAGYILHMLGHGFDDDAPLAAGEAKMNREQALFLETLIDQSPFALFVTDPEGRLIRGNPALWRLLQIDEAHVVGHYNILKDEHLVAQDVMPRIRRVFEAGETARFTLDWRAGRVGGADFEGARDVYIDAVVFPIHDDAGRLRNVVCQWTDITEHKATEREQKRLQGLLEQAHRLEAVGRLAGGVAHDFNNMLSVILGSVDLAREALPDDDPLQDDLGRIRNAGERSTLLTRQLLGFASRQTIAPVILDLDLTVSSLLAMLERLIGENIDLLWRPSGHLDPIRIDPSQVDQVLANLVLNARDAIAGVGKVTIETAAADFDSADCDRRPGCRPGRYAMLAVSDDGHGMDADTLAHIFEPFYTDKAVGKGTGLGLATVYGIVKQNGGFINVYSEPGRGSTFRIYLPTETDAPTETPLERAPAPKAEPGHETILVVEDEPEILEMNRRILAQLGYEVLATTSPLEALRLAEAHERDIHLLITDVVMPDLNGRDLADRILAGHPETRSLFTSGYTHNVIAHHGVLDPGVQFLQKPYTLIELSAAIRRILDD